MDRAVDPELLRLALGGLARLPTAEELAHQLAAAEVDLLVGSESPDDALLATGWFLFAVASSRLALDRYGLPRQRAAFRVASHIFDVALQQRRADLPRGDRLELCLAAQLASVRSELTPNAAAIYQREFPNGPGVLRFATDGSDVALAVAAALVAMDLNYVRRSTDDLRIEVRRLIATWGVARLSDTIYAAASGAAFGCRDLAVFLLYGDRGRLEQARLTLRRAARAEVSEGDFRSRWVAAQLLDFIDGLGTASIWTGLPPDVPDVVRRAFVLMQPPIAQLWPPQLDLLGSRTASGAHPLSADCRRQLICTPTSGGKTLIAQLLIATHLATSATSVCYVAPTRSLCHEVRTGLDRRLRYLGKHIQADLPMIDEDGLMILLGQDGDVGVEVMTPERLAYLLRADAQAVLSRFGLFVFDEAHNVAEVGRGWTLESAIAYLHHATRDSGHRLVLVSAAIGNRHHFVQWLTGEGDAGDVIAYHRDWRGPRRLHCLWTTDARWRQSVEEPAEGGRQARQRVPVHGRLSVRLAATGASRHLFTDSPIGMLVRRLNRKQEWQKDAASTPFYRMLVPLIRTLMSKGPVLAIEATRANTRRLAQEIAGAIPAQGSAELREVLDLAEARLGGEHPLTAVLRHGVAYHHGSLPAELRTAIEEAVTDGLLQCVVATTTLTEGINLPVRSVVIANQGVNTAEGMHEFITGSRLINAIGRAGRAVKETEGVVVLARAAAFDAADFERLQPDDDAMRVTSMLATEGALAELAAFEALGAASEDAVFDCAGEALPRFLSFVWFLASALEAVEQEVTPDAVAAGLRGTLGWTQIDDGLRARWDAAARAAVVTYLKTDAEERRRWASASAVLSSARRLDQLAADIDAALPAGATFTDPMESLDLMLGGDRLPRLLVLEEAPRRAVWNRRAGGRHELHISLPELLRDWIAGTELTVLANQYLGDVSDSEYRYEQLGDLLNDYCETFLPWVLGTLVGWVNRRRELADAAPPFPREMAAYVRYGVRSLTALQLAIGGVRSRRLCTAVAAAFEQDQARDSSTVRVWLAGMTVADWRSRFGASTAEMRNLVQYTRSETSGVAEALLTGSEAQVGLEPRVEEQPRAAAEVRPSSEEEIAEVDVWCGERLVGAIPAHTWPDVQVLLNSGISFTAEAEVSSSGAALWLKPQAVADDVVE